MEHFLLWVNNGFNLKNFSLLLFILFVLLMLALLYSRRMDARAEEAAPAPRLLLQLASALAPASARPAKKTRGKGKPAAQNQQKQKKKTAPLPLPPRLVIFLQNETRLSGVLRKTDRLLYDKLRLLPDARTGRRLNFFMMLFAAWIAANAIQWLTDSKAVSSSLHFRYVGPELLQQSLPGLWKYLLSVALFTFACLLPFLLIQKNREIYLDLQALLLPLVISLHKGLFCWRDGCCFGIPWPWGVYNEWLGTTVFPVQIFEFAVGILCAVLGILYMLYAKSYRPGRGCSFCILSYAVPRFFWEYLRYHDESYRLAETEKFLGLTIVHFICVALAMVAVAWLFLLPLEKKLMDRFWLFATGGLRRAASKARYFSKWMEWRQSAGEEV